jgi:hypothetical protein
MPEPFAMGNTTEEYTGTRMACIATIHLYMTLCHTEKVEEDSNADT